MNVTDEVPHNRYDSRVIINVERLTLMGDHTLESSSIFVHSHGPILITGGYNVSSLIHHTCSAEYHVPMMFSCVPAKSLQDTITMESFIGEFQSKFNSNVKKIENTVNDLAKGYLIYLMSEQSIILEDSRIEAPRIGFCAPDVTANSSMINAAQKGCWGGHGIGKGMTHKNCSGSGGAHGGHGGYGLSLHNKICKRFVPVPYSWNDEASYEGSSGSSALENLSYYGGVGGGIVWVVSTGTVTLNSTEISVKGGDGLPVEEVTLGSGGGAGGSVHIVTRNIAGNGTIDASGGDGSIYGGGGGSGGRLVATLLTNFNSTNHHNQSHFWNGTINLRGGLGGLKTPQTAHELATNKNLLSGGDGEDGTTKQTKCFGGYSGPFCKPCPIGTYKYNFGYGVCQPCSNKPVNSFYDDIG